ncbi:hypothetical protein ABT282_08815 [Streptomyces sp. NPDC000927]|uniref:hypothetical protein n=1 Tax=Streptomyces sp. NPDC000927 TaxID=3154371 RepID=UPI00332E2CC1
MNRIKQAWAVLAGQARATDLSQDLLDKINNYAPEREMTTDELVTGALEMFRATAEYADEMEAKVNSEKQAVIDAAEEVIRNA